MFDVIILFNLIEPVNNFCSNYLIAANHLYLYHGVMDVRELIEAFGGTSKVAAHFGVTMPAVSNWKASNKLPHRLHLKIMLEAKKRRIKVPLELFDIT